ncbi:T9SS type A sorting domain-containing protein, partial [Xanthomarina sp.]|uniref:T9SS type A sorting domain-containing protein n=1 Tax=Xanthomarina sp. TaxID=1931211 RepID=UPI002C143235
GVGKNESTPDYFFKGDIGEIIMYKKVVNEAQRIIIDNYLSAKYNIPLADNNFYTHDDGNKIYDHHVAGIGKTTGTNIHSDSQGTGIVRINNPSSLPDNSFLFWGEDTKNPTYHFTTNNHNYSEQLASKWRVSKIGDIGHVAVSFDVSNMDLSGWNGCKELQLVVANNSNFTSPRVYSLTVAGNNAAASNVVFNDGDYFTIRYVHQIVWDGNRYFNGSRPDQAPNNDSDKCLKLLVKAGNKAVLIENAYVREIEVQAGAVLEVKDGVELSVQDKIVNNGTIDLLGEAQLIQEHVGISQNSGLGKLKIRQQGTTNLYNYNYWSAPVNTDGSWQIKFLEQNNGPIGFTPAHNADPTTNPIKISSRWLNTYNASETLSDGITGWIRINSSTLIPPGIGYSMKGSGSSISEEEYVFSGEANSGDYSYPVTAGNDFLIGNPYPSALSAEKFINENKNVIDGTLYFYEQFKENNTHVWREYQGGYATLNLLAGVAASAADSQLGTGGNQIKGAPTNNIAVGQGFFVNIKTNGTLKFTNKQRVFAKESNGGSIFYRENAVNNDSRTKFWLHFTDPTGRAREIALGYDDNASVGFDTGYDAIDYSDYPDKMLWYTPENLLVIQGLNRFSEEDEIPLSIKVTTPGTYTIRLDRTLNFPENTAIYLKDNQENNFYNLKTEDLSIVFEAGTFNNRYSIVYQRETLSLPTLEGNQSIYVKFDKNDDTVQLLGLDNLNSVQGVYIYAMDGKQVKSFKNIDSKVFNVSYLNDGVYILKLEMVSGATKNIRFVKY